MPQPTPQSIVYSYVRTLEGITGVLTSPPTVTFTSAFGPRVDKFLISQGFQVGTVELIQKVYKATRPDMNAFVDRLAGYGYPITEARFLYSFITDE